MGGVGTAVEDNLVEAGGTSKNHFSHVRIDGVDGYRGKHSRSTEAHCSGL